MSLYNDASLVMIPSAYKDGKLYSIKPTDGSGDFTFSRGSNLAATRVDENGLIEKGRENVMLYSQDFTNAQWVAFNATKTTGQSDPNGGNTAVRVVSTAVVNSGLYVFDTTNFGTNKMRTASVWMKGAVGGEVVQMGDATNRVSVTLTTNWVRYEAYAIDNSTYFVLYSNSTAQTWDVAFAQYEDGLVATDYIETTTTTAQAGILEDMPRLDYSGSCPSLLLEPTRTNALNHSEYFNGWTQLNTITTDNAAVSPEGVQNAAKLIASSGTSNKVIYQGITANTYTASVFAKKGELEGLLIATGTTGAFFNLNTQSFRADYSAPVTSYKIENYGNGWFRYSITFTEASGNNLYIGPNDNVSTSLAIAGDGTSGIYIYGAMLEVGSYPTSYIPCYGAATTRSSDFNNQNDLISTPYVFDANDNFTFMYEGSFFEENGQSNMLCGGGKFNLGSTYKSYWWLRTDTDQIQLNGDGEVAMAVANYTFPAVGTNGKYLVRKSDGVIDFFVNGTKLTTTQFTTNLRFDVRSAFWSYNTSVYQVSGKAKQFLIFETGLTDSECIALTTL